MLKRITTVAAMAFINFAVPQANAASLTLTFDEYACTPGRSSGPFTGDGRRGSVQYNNPNQNVYNNCGERIKLGDDGWRQTFSITADPDTEFDLMDFDFTAKYNITRIARDTFTPAYAADLEGSYGSPLNDTLSVATTDWDVVLKDPEPEIVSSFDYFGLWGYRDGVLVASTTFDPRGGGTHSADPSFRGLTKLLMGVTVSGYFIYGDDDYLYGCGWQCGSATVDNVSLTTRAVGTAPGSVEADPPAPVPLPAGFPALLAALTVLGLVRRSRMSAR